MTLEQSILEAIQSLPSDKQQELLDHAWRLRAEMQSRSPFRTVKGLWADLDISLAAEEIDDVRRDIWKEGLLAR